VRLRIAFVVLALSVLACGQYVGTPTPAVTPEPQEAPPTVTPSPAPARVTPSATTEDVQTATVRAALVNVRATPDGEVIGQLQAGTDVRIIECGADWCEIEADGMTGFVFIGCLSLADGRGCVAK
jgi:uncharacterized protein YraI